MQFKARNVDWMDFWMQETLVQQRLLPLTEGGCLSLTLQGFPFSPRPVLFALGGGLSTSGGV